LDRWRGKSFDANGAIKAIDAPHSRNPRNSQLKTSLNSLTTLYAPNARGSFTIIAHEVPWGSDRISYCGYCPLLRMEFLDTQQQEIRCAEAAADIADCESCFHLLSRNRAIWFLESPPILSNCTPTLGHTRQRTMGVTLTSPVPARFSVHSVRWLPC